MTPEMLTALIDKYGPQVMIQIVGVILLARMVLAGLRFFNRLTDTNAQRATTQNTLDESQMKLTLTAMDQAGAAQTRLGRMQDSMIEEQRQNRETMNRLINQVTGASLLIEKSLRQLELLITQITDWDERFSLYVRAQKEQNEVIVQMGKAVAMLLTLLTPKDTAS